MYGMESFVYRVHATLFHVMAKDPKIFSEPGIF